MAYTDRLQPAPSLKGMGMDEANPIMQNAAFFRTNGLHSQFGDVRRINGKELFTYLGEPVVAIHSAQMVPSIFWIQTPTALYIADSLG